MAPLPLRIGIKPQSRTLTLNPLQALRPFSSSSRPFNGESNDDTSPPPPRSSTASLFNDIKEKLRSQQAPPRPPPPPIAPPEPSPPLPIDDIRKRLAEFRSRPSSNPNPSFSPTRGPSGDRPTSYQELFKRIPPNNSANTPAMSYETMRESIGKIRPSTDPRRSQRLNVSGPSLIGDQENLPESIFGREMREKEGGVEGEAKELKTELVKMYGDEELGEKLRRLRPEAAERGKKDWFSLDELNLRLAKLRELEESELKSERGGKSTMFSDLRKSLMKLKHSDDSKKASK